MQVQLCSGRFWGRERIEEPVSREFIDRGEMNFSFEIQDQGQTVRVFGSAGGEGTTKETITVLSSPGEGTASGQPWACSGRRRRR
jgi:hypothetical protein